MWNNRTSRVADGSWPRRMAAGLTVLAFCLAIPAATVAWQGSKGKKGPETEKIEGKVTGIEKKGKAATVTIEEDDGQTHEVLLPARLKVAINGKGDADFLRPKVWVSSQKVVMVNNLLFCSRYTVHVGTNPPPLLRPEQGSEEIYHVSGQVVAIDDNSVTLNVGNPKQTQKIAFEVGAPLDIAVSMADLDLIVEGSEIELEGVSRGTKFTPQKATVKLAQPLTAAEVFGAEKGKADKAKSAGKSGKKPSKAKDDSPTVDEPEKKDSDSQ